MASLHAIFFQNLSFKPFIYYHNLQLIVLLERNWITIALQLDNYCNSIEA
jgi:hypothetical protein